MSDEVVLQPSTNDAPYNYYKADSGALAFKVKSRFGNASFALITKHKPHQTVYEVLLAPETCVTDLTRSENVETPEIILVDYQEFWVTWYGNQIRIGHGGQNTPFICFIANDSDPKLIGFFKYKTGGKHYPHRPATEWMFADVPEVPSKPPKTISGGSVQWAQHNGEMPANSIIGGFEDNTHLYVARAQHARSLTPGKYRQDMKVAFVPWGHRAHAKREFEILCGFDMEWVHTTENNIPLNAVIGGYSEVGQTPLYIGRAYHEGHLLVGKVHTLYSACFLPYQDREIEVHKYEIMVSRAQKERGIRCKEY